MSTNGDWALYYARTWGWSVLPVWGVNENGTCRCGSASCGKNTGKHPHARLVPHGEREASRDEAVISRWWSVDPTANIAVAAGPSGLLILDPEDDEGDLELRQWAAGFGCELPPSLLSATGGGGYHHFYLRSIEIPKKERFLERVDLRASSGYVVLPPSRHASGRYYAWARGPGDGWVPVPAPAELELHLREVRGRAVANGNGNGAGPTPAYDYRDAVENGPRAGFRDHFFNARAFELRRLGVSPDDAAADMMRLWHAAEHPPGDEYPLERVAEKLRRVYRDVNPDDSVVVPDWPAGAAGAGESDGDIEAPPPYNPILDDHRGRDIANAARLVDLVAGRWIWTAALGWLRYEIGRWARDETDEIFEYAKEVQRRLMLKTVQPGVSADDKERWQKAAQEASTSARLRAMVDVAHSDPAVAVSVHRLDQLHDVMPCPNGTIELKTGDLRPNQPEDFATMWTEVEYAPGYVSERWDRYLRGTFNGDDDLIAYVQRVCGSMMVGRIRDKSLYVLLGEPDSGKTTFANILQTVLGDHAMFVAPEFLLMGRAGQGNVMPQHELARLRGKRLVISDEPQQGARWAEGLLKQLTGDDTVTGCFKYKDSFEMRPTWSLLVAANHMPQVRDPVMAARVKVIPTTRPAELDPSLREDSRDPASDLLRAALAWCVAGSVIADREGVGSCLAVETASAEYRYDQDALGQFIEQCLEHTGRAERPYPKVLDAYALYERWAETRGEQPVAYRRFVTELREHRVRMGEETRVGKVLIGWKIRESAQIWPSQGV